MENDCFLELKEYLKQAKSCFRKYRGRNGSEDEISRVAEYMIRGDMKYKQGEEHDRRIYRWYWGKYGCLPPKKKTLDYHCKPDPGLKNTLVDKSNDIENHEVYDFVFSSVPNMDGQIFVKYYFEGFTLADLSKEYNISPSSIHRKLHSIKERLKAKYV